MTEHNYLEMLAPAIDALQHGRALLTVKGAAPNTMTIGWGMIGFLWNRPIFMVVVRPQRHTHHLISDSEDFTVSMALSPSLTRQLHYAGTVSGRDEDKFSGHGLTAVPAERVSSPIVGECQLHFECRKVLTQDMTAQRMAQELLDRAYPQRDLHTMYFGEIVSCYTTED